MINTQRILKIRHQCPACVVSIVFVTLLASSMSVAEQDAAQVSSSAQPLQESKLSPEEFALAQAHEKELRLLRQAKERLAMENDLQKEKNRQLLANLQAERDRLLLENEIKEAERKQKLADLLVLKERLELQTAIREAEQSESLAQLQTESAKLELENTLLEARTRKEQIQIDLEDARLKFKTAQMEYEKSLRNRYLDELDEKIAARSKWEQWEMYADAKPQYLTDPFIDGQLILSDRSIQISNVILPGEASYIAERINFYNNKNSEYPIFLIIDRCSGGSVAEGAQILKAMQSSHVPVYVVVRSLAASMAAVLTTLAERSFAYPNALIIHHQVSSMMFGNLTQQQENLDMTMEWAHRLMRPVAEKMGLTLDAFIAQMYIHNSDGNWQEFADNAQKLGWVDHVVTSVVDTSFITHPIEPTGELLLMQNESPDQHNEHSMPYKKLPHLSAGDLYFLYNPDNYYR